MEPDEFLTREQFEALEKDEKNRYALAFMTRSLLP